MSLLKRIQTHQRTALVAANPHLARCTCLVISPNNHYHERSCPLFTYVRPAKDMTNQS